MDNIIKKEELRVSFSQVSTYRQCPHKWYLNYLLKYPGDVSEELIFGSSVHAVIEELLTNKLMQRLYEANPEGTIKDIFKSALKDELIKITDLNFLQKFKANNLGSIFMFQAMNLVKELDFPRRFKEWEIADVEYKLDGLTIGENEKCKIVFKGFIDLVLKHKTEEETFMILDWKTSGKKWDIVKKMKDNKDFFAQLCLYKNFYSDVKGIPFNNIQTKFYNLPRMEPKQQSIYSGNLRKEYVDDYIKGFVDTCFTMFDHRESMKDFEKIKMKTKQNFCFRCKYNTEELCNDTQEFQKISPIITP